MVWCAAESKYRCMRCGISSDMVNMPGKCEGPRWLGKDSDPELEGMGNTHQGGNDMVRRVDPNGEVLVWCRRRSGCTRCCLGPKLMNRCRPEKQDRKGARQKRERVENRRGEEEELLGQLARG